MSKRAIEAFIVGIALGDGNLSNPNGRAVRLRITCDSRYKNIIAEICAALKSLFPDNKVSAVSRKDNCVDVSIYSNKLAGLIPWEVSRGTKYEQKAHVPSWIFTREEYILTCLRGLILSDGSIYLDRTYLMVNISTNIQPLAHDILELASLLGFRGRLSIVSQPSGKPKHTIRFSKNTERLLEKLQVYQKS
jgi:DNA-binding transcriptional regulator WhiA